MDDGLRKWQVPNEITKVDLQRDIYRQAFNIWICCRQPRNSAGCKPGKVKHKNIPNYRSYHHTSFFYNEIAEWVCCGDSGPGGPGCQYGPIMYHTGRLGNRKESKVNHVNQEFICV